MAFLGINSNFTLLCSLLILCRVCIGLSIGRWLRRISRVHLATPQFKGDRYLHNNCSVVSMLINCLCRGRDGLCIGALIQFRGLYHGEYVDFVRAAYLHNFSVMDNFRRAAALVSGYRLHYTQEVAANNRYRIASR